MLSVRLSQYSVRSCASAKVFAKDGKNARNEFFESDSLRFCGTTPAAAVYRLLRHGRLSVKPRLPPWASHMLTPALPSSPCRWSCWCYCGYGCLTWPLCPRPSEMAEHLTGLSVVTARTAEDGVREPPQAQHVAKTLPQQRLSGRAVAAHRWRLRCAETCWSTGPYTNCGAP